MESVGKRLERALKLRGRKLYWLAQQLKGPDDKPFPRGASYASLHACIDKDAPLSLAVLEHAARALEVPPEWLITGVGSPTPAHAAVEAASTEAEASAQRRLVLGRGKPAREVDDDVEAQDRRRLRDAVLRALGVEREHPPYWVGPLLELWMRRIMQGFREDRAGWGMQPAAEEVGRALAAPLEAFGISPADLPEEALDQYVLAMVPALLPIAWDPHWTPDDSEPAPEED